MANLKEVRNRMVSVKSTQQITKAMKMVSAAKLRKAQTKIQQMRPYAERLYKIMGNLAGSVDSENLEKFYTPKKSDGRTLFVLITADRGLCGGFNSGLYKELMRNIKLNHSDALASNKIDFYTVGKKGRDMVKTTFPVLGSHNGFFQSFGWNDSIEISNKLISLYEDGEYSSIYLVYNQFRNAAVYFNTVEKFLPIENTELPLEPKSTADYIFEPSKQEIMEELIPTTLRINFFKALLDSNAAEHGSRMTAMDNATENAQDLLRALSIEYNKARQASITTEILEIVGGAEALAG